MCFLVYGSGQRCKTLVENMLFAFMVCELSHQVIFTCLVSLKIQQICVSYKSSKKQRLVPTCFFFVDKQYFKLILPHVTLFWFDN